MHDTQTSPIHTPKPRLTTALVALMAITTGLCAGGNYFNQPLLATIATHLRISEGTAGITVTLAQASYGLGLLLLVPLGDLVEKRQLTVGLLLLSALGQALCGFAPNAGVLMAGTAIAGFFSVAAQVLVPFAAELAEPGTSGRVVGTVMSGLLIGVLLGRSVSGLLAPLGGWQFAYRLAAAAMVLTAFALWRMLPTSPRSDQHSYGRVLASLPHLLAEHPRLATRSAMGGLSFAGMSVLFATMAFMLHGRYGMTELEIGLVGFAAVAGALLASFVGRLADRGLTLPTTFVGLVVMLGTWALVYVGEIRLIWFLMAMVLLDVALQSVHISNQAIVFALDPASRARINSVYMTSYFVGGAVGSALGLWAWQAGGWAAVCWLGTALTGVALLVALRDARLSAIPVS